VPKFCQEIIQIIGTLQEVWPVYELANKGSDFTRDFFTRQSILLFLITKMPTVAEQILAANTHVEKNR